SLYCARKDTNCTNCDEISSRLDCCGFMKLVSRFCSKCGGEIFSDAAEGLCTACLLETGLGLFSEAAERINDPDRADHPPRIDNRAANGSTVAASDAQLPGILGDYELLEEIGRGGQGVVYRA